MRLIFIYQVYFKCRKYPLDKSNEEDARRKYKIYDVLNTKSKNDQITDVNLSIVNERAKRNWFDKRSTKSVRNKFKKIIKRKIKRKRKHPCVYNQTLDEIHQ